MPTKSLKVIPKPVGETRTVLTTPVRDKEFVYFQGPGDTELACGQCGKILSRGFGLENIVLLCNQCGSYNEVE